MTFLRPILSATIPPGSWKRIRLVFWIRREEADYDEGCIKDLHKVQDHHSSQRPLKTLYSMFVEEMVMTFLLENTCLRIEATNIYL